MRQSVEAWANLWDIAKRTGWASFALLICFGAVAATHRDERDMENMWKHVCPCDENDRYPDTGDRNKPERNTLVNEYINSVFRVETEGEKPSDQHEFIGNATLVSREGHFLTAAHVVMVSQGKKLWVSHGPLDAITRYQVRPLYVGKPGSSPDTVRDDIALLKATDWNDGRHDPANPVPLRYSGRCDDGIFIAYSDPDGDRGPTRVDVTAGAQEGDPHGCFHGSALRGRSGSLILDPYGFGEGVVAAADIENAMKHAGDQGGVEKILESVDEGENFGAGEITEGADWLRLLPLDPPMGEDIDGFVDVAKTGHSAATTWSN